MKSKRFILFLFIICVMAVLPSTSFAQDIPNALLEVSANGTIYKGEADWIAAGNSDVTAATAFINQNTIPIASGGSLQLKINLVGANGQRTDITADPNTHYVVVTDWNISVSGTGLVTQQANPDYSGNENLINSKDGQISIWYKDGSTLGYNSVLLRIN